MKNTTTIKKQIPINTNILTDSQFHKDYNAVGILQG